MYVYIILYSITVMRNTFCMNQPFSLDLNRSNLDLLQLSALLCENHLEM